jgi:hypothetical protein
VRQEHPPHWNAGIHVLTARNELDSQLVKFPHELEKIFGAQTETVEGTYYEHGKTTMPSISHQRIKTGMLPPGACATVFIHDSFETTPLGEFLQAANLGLGGLVRTRSPYVNSGLLH